MKLGRWIGLMALLVALYLLWRIRQVLLLIFTAVVLTIPLNRLVQRWYSMGMQRSVATSLSVVTLLTSLFLISSLIVPPYVEQLRRLVGLVILGLERLQSWFIELQNRLPESFRPVSSADSLVQQVQPLITWGVDHFFALFSDALVVLLNLLLVLVLTVMLLANPAAYRHSLIQLFPSFYRSRIDVILTECEDKLVVWMQATLWRIAIVGVLSAIGLWLLQVPLVLTNASLAGLLETIPNVGVVLSLIPPFAAAWLGSPEKAVAVIGLYLVIQAVKHYSLIRLGQRKPDTILPAIMLLAQISLAFFCGFSGLLLAVPIMIVAQVSVREIFVKDLLGARSKGWQTGRWRKRRREAPGKQDVEEQRGEAEEQPLD